jgi:hypothetical protein
LEQQQAHLVSPNRKHPRQSIAAPQPLAVIAMESCNHKLQSIAKSQDALKKRGKLTILLRNYRISGKLPEILDGSTTTVHSRTAALYSTVTDFARLRG